LSEFNRNLCFGTSLKAEVQDQVIKHSFNFHQSKSTSDTILLNLNKKIKCKIQNKKY
jgi:hypothetical protein